MKVIIILGFGLALLSSGCYPKVHNLPLNMAGSPVFEPLKDPENIVGVAISGGGSRAATFAAGAMEALAGLKVHEGGREVSALEKVNYISSVSGGSLSAAYYAVKKPPKDIAILSENGISQPYQEFFTSYKRDMQKNFQRRALIRQLLFFRALNPTKLAYSLSEVWDSNFFKGVTFSGLYEREQRGDSPRLIINGTLYNNGRRFALTTLTPKDFDYDFIQLLKEDITSRARERGGSDDELSVTMARLERSREQLLSVTFEEIRGDHRDLRVSLAVATSASFPPVVGPVTYSVKDEPPYSHVGDGGLFDNLGNESLTQVFLKKIPKGSSRKGIIIAIDASYPFDVKNVELDKENKGFDLFKDDPARIVGIMEERANAYQLALWHILRSEQILLPDFDHFRIVLLKHTDAEWGGYDDLPSECSDKFPRDVTPEGIRQKISQIPTLFKVDPCNGALLIKAAHKVVEKQHDRIVNFLQGEN